MPRAAYSWNLFAVLMTLWLAPSVARAWGGEGCAPVPELRQLVEAALASAPFGGGRGSTAASYSVALEHDDCGRFSYAVGRRQIGPNRPAMTATRQHIGSMTKPVATALALMLAEEGLLGPDGLDARVADFFTRAERKQLTKGTDGSNRLCPATILGPDRVTEETRQWRARCPKLRKIRIRHLLNGNHGLWDFVNEVDRNRNGFADIGADFLLGDLLEAVGIERMPLPGEVDSALSVLTTAGLLRNAQAKVGGSRPRDFEASFGNTGYQLLGVILEKVSGESFDRLVESRISRPLGLGKIEQVSERPRKLGKLSSQYIVATGAEDSGIEGLDESLAGVYPMVDINGHPAVDVFDLGPVRFSNGGGAAGALSASPASYAGFFHALVTGQLLSAAAQAELEAGFLRIDNRLFEHGFALFRSSSVGLGTVVNKGGQTAGSTCLAIHSVADQGGNGVTGVACSNSTALFLPNEDTGLDEGAASVESLVVNLVGLARP